MSKKERAEHPPSSSRYPRSSHKAGLGSSSTKVQVLGDAFSPERGYDSEVVRDAAAPHLAAGYHTEGQPSTGKRSSKSLYRTVLEPTSRAHGNRLSSMPAAQPQPASFGYPYDARGNQLDAGANYGPPPMPEGDESAVEQNSSLRRVKKEKDRRHRDRERDKDAQSYDRPDPRAVPPDVWMQQVVPQESRARRRESRSTRRQDENPLPTQSDPPRPFAQSSSQSSYPYTQQLPNSASYRPVNAAHAHPVPHDQYRLNPSTPGFADHYAPPAAQNADLKPRYDFVIDDRAGLRSPPPVEIPHAHAFLANTAPEYYPRSSDSLALQPPRSLAQLKADGIVPSSPRRTHRPARSEDINPAVFADGAPSGPFGSHAERPSLRHRSSRGELGLGQPQALNETLDTLVRPVHIGRSASETVVPQQLPTPGTFGAGLAVTSGRGVPGERGAVVMRPQLQESFAESAHASRAPVNAAMANAAVHVYSNGHMESDSSSIKEKETSSRRTMKRDKKTRRSSRQSDITPPPPADVPHAEPGRQAQAEVVRQLIDPSPPPVVVGYPSGRRPRTTSGRSAAQNEEREPEPDPDTVVYRSPEPVIVGMSGANPRRMSRVSLGPPRNDTLLGSRPEATVNGAGATRGTNPPHGDGGYEVRGGGAGVSASARRGSMIEGTGVDERIRRPSTGAEEQGRRPQVDTKRRSIDSDSSRSYESAVLAASTANTHDAQEFSSAKDAMSPRSNYYSIAASVKSGANSVVNEARSTTNEARNLASDAREAATYSAFASTTRTTPAPPPVQPRQGGVRTSSAPSINAFPTATKHIVSNAPPRSSTLPMRPVDVTSPPEMYVRPRVLSGGPPAPLPAADAPPHRATVDVHARENILDMPVDEEGRLIRTPAVSQTMPNRAPRQSLTRQAPPPLGIVTPVASPPQPHAQTQPPEPQVNALPKNLQQQQPIGSSKESLVENVKGSGKSKSSTRWFWGRSKPSETNQNTSASAHPQAPSPAPPSVTSPPSYQRARHQSLLNGLKMGTSISKSKSSQKVPEPAPPGHRLSTDMYQMADNTPSSVTLDDEHEPVKKDESRMPRVFTSLKNSLRRTPSTSGFGHKFSRSMSKLPGTSHEAPLRRVSSAKDSAWPMSPQRAKEPLRPTKDNEPPPLPSAAAAVPPSDPVRIPSPAQVSFPTTAMSPAASPPTIPRAPAQKERLPEPVPTKDERRFPGKDVPVIEKGRSAAPTPSHVSADANGRLIDVTGRPVDSISRPTDSSLRGVNGQRPGVQAIPPTRAASPPLVGRPVGPTRVPANGPSGIFNSSTRPSNPSVTPHIPSRTQPRGRSLRDPAPMPTPGPVYNTLRTPRPREAVPVPIEAPVPTTEPTNPTPERSLPTPEATPRSSPTGEAMFGNSKPSQSAPPRETNRPPNIAIPPPDMMAVVGQRLEEVAAGGLAFDHRQKRAVSIASLEAVTGQEAHFRSEASSIRTVTPGPGQTSFPRQDPISAAQTWTTHQFREDRLAGRQNSVSRRPEEEKRYRGGLKRNKGGSRKPGVAFDFPGPAIAEDPEMQPDIDYTYEMERRNKRYK